MAKTKGQRTEARILEVASILFWRSSYHGVKVSDIAAGANINKATLYQYFKTKEVLAEAVVSHNRERTIDYVFDGAFAVVDTPLERLAEIYTRLYCTQRDAMDETGETRGCPFVNIAAELATTSEEVRLAVNRALREFRAYYLKIVRQLRGHREGVLREAEIADGLIKLMNGAMIQAKIERDPSVIIRTLREANRLAVS